MIQISEAVVKLEMKKKEIDSLLEKENQQREEFKEMISDSKFVEFLTKVYNKKIRRSKKKAADRPGNASLKTSTLTAISVCVCNFVVDTYIQNGMKKRIPALLSPPRRLCCYHRHLFVRSLAGYAKTTLRILTKVRWKGGAWTTVETVGFWW